MVWLAFGLHLLRCEGVSLRVEVVRGWVKDDLTLVKIHLLLARRGVEVPYRTLHRFAMAEAGYGRRAATVRVDDGEPGMEVQVDFGKMGLVPDPATGRRRVVHALIFTACYSRHNFVFLTHHQTTKAVIEGFEAAWAFFGGVFKVVIPENVPRNIVGVLCPVALCGVPGVEHTASLVNEPLVLIRAT